MQSGASLLHRSRTGPVMLIVGARASAGESHLQVCHWSPLQGKVPRPRKGLLKAKLGNVSNVERLSYHHLCSGGIGSRQQGGYWFHQAYAQKPTDVILVLPRCYAATQKKPFTMVIHWWQYTGAAVLGSPYAVERCDIRQLNHYLV